MLSDKLPQAEAILLADTAISEEDKEIIAAVGVLITDLSDRGYNTLALALFLTIGNRFHINLHEEVKN